MTTYIVTRKSDGQEVSRYAHTAPVEWQGMEFATHDHTELVEVLDPVAAPVGRAMTKLEFLRRFTATERVTLRQAATQNPYLADYMNLLELAGEIRTDDPDTVSGLGMLEAAGLIEPGRAAEILGGA